MNRATCSPRIWTCSSCPHSKNRCPPACLFWLVDGDKICGVCRQTSAVTFRLDVLSVHPDYTRNNLARKLTVESCRLAAEAGVQWAQITGSAVATNRVARALNFRPFFHLPLAEYKRAGERVFPDVSMTAARGSVRTSLESTN
ncbi:hypothetical protein M3Y99_00546000 [Aphelenchoides fujianensis]|nr:hypothetical protein M3Y99_00546000 [Aphelenchoides fujianensis]